MRLGIAQRAGGLVVPVLTAVLAFLAGGIVVAATGHNPWTVYKGIWDGAGFNWLFHIPWNTNTIHLDAYNLSQTLLTMTTLILVGLAVAFSFRCGPVQHRGARPIHRRACGRELGRRQLRELADAAARAAPGLGAAAGAPALRGRVSRASSRRPRGRTRVISTIHMLNYVAFWGAQYLFGQGGPLQNTTDIGAPESATIAQSAQIPTFWGSSLLQGLDYGFFARPRGARSSSG